jgi:hypothetical protein
MHIRRALLYTAIILITIPLVFLSVVFLEEAVYIWNNYTVGTSVPVPSEEVGGLDAYGVITKKTPYGLEGVLVIRSRRRVITLDVEYGDYTPTITTPCEATVTMVFEGESVPDEFVWTQCPRIGDRDIVFRPIQVILNKQ